MGINTNCARTKKYCDRTTVVHSSQFPLLLFSFLFFLFEGGGLREKLLMSERGKEEAVDLGHVRHFGAVLIDRCCYCRKPHDLC